VLKQEGFNVGELIREGLILQTAEAVALVHESSRSAPEVDGSAAFAATPDDLWLTEAGELRVLPSATNATTDVRLAAAALLDVLLPPQSDRPELTVPASLRTLPDRLRDYDTPPESGHVRDLLWILTRHMPRDPHAVLRHLAIRADARQTPADGRPRPSAPDLQSVTTPTAVPFPVTPSHSALAVVDTGIDLSVSAVPVLDAGSDLTYSPQQQSQDELSFDAFRRSEASGSFAQPARRSLRRAALVLVPVLLVAASGYAGYSLTRSWISTHASTAIEEPSADQSNPSRLDKALGMSARGDAEASTIGSSGASGVTAPLSLPVDGDTFSPSFAPSGDALFFHAGRTPGTLLEADLDDRGTVARVTKVLGAAGDRKTSSDYHARVSPDGRLIAFDSDRDGERGVYVASRGGGDAHRVSGSGFAAVPSWSPDMKWLAFVRAEPAGSKVWNLWLRNVAAGTLTRVTSFPVGQTWGASWFPDNRRLCYSHDTELIVQDVETGMTATFRTPQAGKLVRTPAVSPDGKRIVFQIHGDGVWILDLQTMAMSRLLNDATAEEFAWDPGGQRIAYHSRRDGQWRIWTTTTPRF
jgi:hypothetical protein